MCNRITSFDKQVSYSEEDIEGETIKSIKPEFIHKLWFSLNCPLQQILIVKMPEIIEKCYDS